MVLFVYPGTEVIGNEVDAPEDINVPGVSGLPVTLRYQFTAVPPGTPVAVKLLGVVPLQTVWFVPPGAGG